MNIRNVTFDQLTEADIAAWSVIQRAHPVFLSPQFRPEFIQLAAAVCDDVEVAVLEQAGAAVGFFPFHRKASRTAVPVGRELSEFEGLIARPDVEWDVRTMMRACRLSCWRFNQLVRAHASLERYAWSSADTAYIDLSGGFDAYLCARSNGKRIMSEFNQRKRKFEREVGPIRYESHVSDPAVLATCVGWKRAQAVRTGLVDIFQEPWVNKFLESILASKGENFAGEMHVAYVRDEIAAINFGMRSGDVFHPIFPTYNVKFGEHSPGMLLWIETMKAAESLGIRRIILGLNDQPYKERLKSGEEKVLIGSVDLRPHMAVARRAWWHTRRSLKAAKLGSPLRSSAKVPARIVNRISAWLAP